MKKKPISRSTIISQIWIGTKKKTFNPKCYWKRDRELELQIGVWDQRASLKCGLFYVGKISCNVKNFLCEMKTFYLSLPLIFSLTTMFERGLVIGMIWKEDWGQKWQYFQKGRERGSDCEKWIEIIIKSNLF